MLKALLLAAIAATGTGFEQSMTPEDISSFHEHCKETMEKHADIGFHPSLGYMGEYLLVESSLESACPNADKKESQEIIKCLFEHGSDTLVLDDQCENDLVDEIQIMDDCLQGSIDACLAGDWKTPEKKKTLHERIPKLRKALSDMKAKKNIRIEEVLNEYILCVLETHVE